CFDSTPLRSGALLNGIALQYDIDVAHAIGTVTVEYGTWTPPQPCPPGALPGACTVAQGTFASFGVNTTAVEPADRQLVSPTQTAPALANAGHATGTIKPTGQFKEGDLRAIRVSSSVPNVAYTATGVLTTKTVSTATVPLP